MIRKLALGFGIATAFATAAICHADEVFPVTHTEPIAVRVMDGLTGKPRAHVVVVVVGGYSEHDLDAGLWRQEVLTDDAGDLQLTDGMRNLPLFRVEVLKKNSCASEGFARTFSMELTRRDGLSASNRCGAVAANGAAGTLTVFVADKKPWLKKHPSKATHADEIDEASLPGGSVQRRSLAQGPAMRVAADAMFFDAD